MSELLTAIALLSALYFAYKYFKQKVAVGSLAEALASRTSILAHSKEFRGTNENWAVLVDRLNELIQEIARLNRQSSGQLNQIETTLDSLQEGVVMIDRDNYILLVNKALQGLFPSMAARVGHRIESGLRSPEFLEFVHEAKRGLGPAKQSIAFSSEGSEVWMEVTAARLTEAEVNGPWFLFVLHDVTKQKQLEVARKHFVANASHELKTPVSVIKGYAETLVSDHETMDSEDRSRFLKTIHRHSERLALLINDLLSLSRLENGTPSFMWSEADILSWIREIVLDYRANVQPSKVRIVLGFEADARAVVRFDVLKLRQVYDNLVENAAKYSPEGGLVTLGAEVGEGALRLWVQDQGPGVPEIDLNRIFERFYRVDKGRSRETGGTGLGLAIVKHIVEGHEGKVWAENAAGGGLRVCFSLPISAKRRA